MATLGDAYINIIPKAPGISANVENLLGGGAAGGAAEKAGASLGKKLIAGISARGIGAMVGKVLKEAFEAGGNLQQSFGGLDTIYGEAAEQAKAFALQAAEAGISANNYAEQAVSFGAALKQAFGGDMEAAVSAANTAIMDMADNAAKMGTDITSIQNAYQGFAKGNYTMLDNLKLGYGGTKAEMERLLEDAEKLSGVHYDIENLGDVYSAIHVIQEELGITGVAADEAKGTLTGSFNAMKAGWENLLAAMTTGTGMEEAVANLTESAGHFAENVIGMLETLAPQIPGFISTLAQAAIKAAPEFIAAGVELILQLGIGLINALPDLIASLPELWNQIKASFASIDWASMGSALVDGIISGIGNAAQRLWDSVTGLASNALGKVKGILGIASPSKVMANEVGKWIPAGIAVGIDSNIAPLDRSVLGMAEGMTADLRRYSAQGSAAAWTDSGLDRLADSISSRPVVTKVVLEGEARKIFRAVRTTNSGFERETGYNALAGGMA